MISEDKLEVVHIGMNMLIKLALAVSSIAAFWVILFHLIDNSTEAKPVSTVTLGFLDAMLSGSMYWIIAHYFPAFKAATKRSNAKPKTPKKPTSE